MRLIPVGFWTLVWKDLSAHIRRKRFQSLAAICILMFVLAAAVRSHDIRRAAKDRELFLERWPASVEEQLRRDENVQIENTREVSPLSILSVGLEPVVPFRFSSTKEGLRFGASRASNDTADMVYGYLDATFLVSTLMSLIAVALTFDAVSGERASGTLPLLLLTLFHDRPLSSRKSRPVRS